MCRCCFPALCVMAIAGCSPVAADAPKATPVTLYDPNPDHLWNRMHAALMTRASADGKRVAQDTLDPQLYPGTKHLLEGPSHAAALKVLDEFLGTDGEKLVRDPLKRVVLQRDLWAVFDWATYPLGNFFRGGEPVKLREGPLQSRLAKAIRKLALTRAEAEALPDTYALAVRSKAFPPAYDRTKRDAVLLPPDLFDADGPWVCVTTPPAVKGPIALTHARTFSGRSVFLVFIKLPEGRKATLAYLDKLNTFPKPWAAVPTFDEDTGRFIDAVVNPAVPQFPVGTQVALVRQAVALTDGGELVATRMTEGVQFRTYLQVPPKDPNDPRQSQGFAEFELRRADLFAQKAGGFHAFKGDETQFGVASTLSSWGDPFESSPAEWFHKPTPAFVSCAACHPHSGILGVNSYTRENRYDPPAAIGLFPTTAVEERKTVLAWKTGVKEWAVLKKHAGW